MGPNEKAFLYVLLEDNEHTGEEAAVIVSKLDDYYGTLVEQGRSSELDLQILTQKAEMMQNVLAAGALSAGITITPEMWADLNERILGRFVTSSEALYARGIIDRDYTEYPELQTFRPAIESPEYVQETVDQANAIQEGLGGDNYRFGRLRVNEEGVIEGTRP